MKKYIYILALGGLIAGSSCSDFLEENPKSNFTQYNYFKNASQAKTAVDGAYERLRALTNNANYGESAWVTLDLLCGHATSNAQSLYNNTYIRHTAGTMNSAFGDIWNGFYEGVANCNLCLAGMNTMEEDEIAELRGEAYALRALYYFYLTRLYGNIPLILEPVTSDSPLMYPEKSSQEKIFESIVSDLKEAEKSGLPDTDETGRVSLGFVRTLLADVYQYMAGYPLNKGTEYYKLAYEKAKEVLDQSYCVSPADPSYNSSQATSAWYSLFDSYDKLHDKANKNKGELIFQIQFSASADATNSITSMIVPVGTPITDVYDKFGSLVPTQQFLDSYEAGDLRAAERGMFFSEYPNVDNGTTIETFSTALYKYFDVDEVTTGKCDLNFTLYRLPEVMLIYAESYTQATGNPDQLAYDMLNAVRSRAGLPSLSGLSKDDFIQAVWKERAHEFCYENREYFDIQRTRKAYNLSSGKFEDYDSFANESGTTFSEKYLLWPIPSTETDVNPKLLPNNQGW